MEKFYLPIAAKTYRPANINADDGFDVWDAVEAYIADHDIEPSKEDSADRQIDSIEEVE
jgi:hypothetical protein